MYIRGGGVGFDMLDGWVLLNFFCCGSGIVGFLRGKVEFALPERFRFASGMLPLCFRFCLMAFCTTK
jgi:hypothetical protein